MKPTPQLILAPALLAALATGIAPARADVRYTTTMQMGENVDHTTDPSAAPQMEMTTFVKGMRERSETAMHMGPIQQKTVTIMQCDRHQSLRLDPDLKIYTVTPVGAVGLAAMGSSMPGQPHPHKAEGKGGEGKVVSTISAQDLGTETVNDRKARHLMLILHNVQSGCLGDHDDTMKFEEWIAPIQGGRMLCPETTAPTRMVDNGNGCHVTYELHGDMSALKTIYGGLPVRMKFYHDGKVVMQQDLTDYSSAVLEDGLFDVPSDYKKLSESDFSKAESQAMMRNMRMPDMTPPADDAGDAPKPKKPKFHFPF